MEHGRPTAVFFDVGNTLLQPHPSVSHVVEEILRAAGHARDLDAIESLMPLVDEYYEDRFRDDDTFWTSEEETSDVWVGMYSLLARRLGIEDGAESLARAVYKEFGKPERWRVYPDVEPAFRRLRDAGVRVGVISNWDGRLEGLLGGLGLIRGRRPAQARPADLRTRVRPARRAAGRLHARRRSLLLRRARREGSGYARDHHRSAGSRPRRLSAGDPHVR
jgi:beta-phosphoglucomutase-like phosphatase (HAD superfamily)